MLNAFFGTRTVVGDATAVTVNSLIRAAPGTNQAPAYAGSGIGCAFSFTADKDVYVGTDSAVTATGGGGLLASGTPFADYATGLGGNVCDPTVWYVFSATTDATLTIFYRAL